MYDYEKYLGGQHVKLFIITLILVQSAFAKNLQDSQFYDYKVYFTNPQCDGYEYDEPVYSFSGELLTKKPTNVYCKHGDTSKNQKRKNTPHYQLVKLLSDKDLVSLQMAYLSFSNSNIIETLCETTIKKNNVKLTLVVDKGNKSDERKMQKLNALKSCVKSQEELKEGEVANIPEIHFRGQVGGLGYAHNKIIYASYKSEPNKVKLVYSSANMSSGTTLHHENWHFVTTAKNTYFAQVHQCILTGMKDYSKSIRANRSLGRAKMSAIQNFKNYMRKCRSDIEEEEENDIKISVVPSDGEETMENIIESIGSAKKVSVAVHRFTHQDLIYALQKAGKKKQVRFIADDDIFWAGEVNRVSDERIVCSPKYNPNAKPTVGANMCNEYFYVQRLVRSRVDVKYMQTNQNVFLLHHNKYIIFEFEDGKDAVHCGAGNFTGAAFSKNFENYYYITIPSVVKKFKKQYDYVWNNLATAEKDLPSKEILP